MSIHPSYIARPALNRMTQTEAPRQTAKFARSMHSSANRVPECVQLNYFGQSFRKNGFQKWAIGSEVFCPEGSRPSINVSSYIVLTKNDFNQQVEKAARQRIQISQPHDSEARAYFERINLPSKPGASEFPPTNLNS